MIILDIAFYGNTKNGNCKSCSSHSGHGTVLSWTMAGQKPKSQSNPLPYQEIISKNWTRFKYFISLSSPVVQAKSVLRPECELQLVCIWAGCFNGRIQIIQSWEVVINLRVQPLGVRAEYSSPLTSHCCPVHLRRRPLAKVDVSQSGTE